MNGVTLADLLANGIIDIEQIRQAEEMKKKKLLEQHPYSIWQGQDGRWCTYLPTPDGKRKFVKLKNRADIENKILERIGKGPTFDQMFNEWNSDRLKRKTIRNATYDQNLRIYNRFCRKLGKEYVTDFTPEMVARFLEQLPSEGNVTAKAFSNVKSIIKAVLKRAKRQGLITFNVVATMEDIDISAASFKRKPPRPGGECFTDYEARLVVSYCKEHIDIQNLGILLLFATGMRVGELVVLRHSDITRTGKGYVISVTRTETIYKGPDGKTVYAVGDKPKTEAGQRSIIVPSDAWGWNWLFETLLKQNRNEEYIFSRNGKRMTTNSIKRRLRRVCIWSGVVPKSPHMIRKTYASMLLDNSVSARIVISQMGHTAIDTTEMYYHKDWKDAEQKIKILGSIPSLGA